MKTTLTILFLLLSVVNAKADYRPLDLYEMILGAERIVYGEIIELDSLTFTIKIEQNLTGQESELEIQRFQNWPCAHRWTEYQIGQKLFLFLETYKEKIYSMSGGNEGELPIYNGSVFINSLSLDPPPPPPRPDGKPIDYSKTDYIESQKHKVYGKNYFGHQTDLNQFAETVLIIRNCFEIEYSKDDIYDLYNNVENVKIICDENNLLNELETNRILNWTYNKLTK